MDDKNLHYGQNIRKLRGILGLNQQDLAEKMNISQQKVSKLENCALLDDETLDAISTAIGIPVDIIKNYDHDKITNIFNNTFNDGGSFINNTGQAQNININDGTFDRIIKLYDQLIQQKDNEIAELKKKNEELSKLLHK